MGNDTIKELHNPYDKLRGCASRGNRFLNIYDLGTGRITWKLNIKIVQKELSFKFHLLENSKIVLSIPLRIESNDDILILKSKTWSDCIKIELYNCQINIIKSPLLYGFLTYEGQNPIPIALKLI